MAQVETKSVPYPSEPLVRKRRLQRQPARAEHDPVVLPTGFVKIPMAELKVQLDLFETLHPAIPRNTTPKIASGKNLWYVIARLVEHLPEPPGGWPLFANQWRHADIHVVAQSRTHARYIAQDLIAKGHKIIDIVEGTRANMRDQYKHLGHLKKGV